MFNLFTAETIKNLPPVEGLNRERLPQVLSLIYAHILGLQTKYGAEESGVLTGEIIEDINLLNQLSFTLELYLESGKYKDYERSLAYVAALAHKLISKIEDEKDAFDKTMIENTTVSNVIINGTQR